MPSASGPDASHEVRARRDGSEAVLKCTLCKGTRRIREGEFAALNEFVDQHRGCRP